MESVYLLSSCPRPIPRKHTLVSEWDISPGSVNPVVWHANMVPRPIVVSDFLVPNFAMGFFSQLFIWFPSDFSSDLVLVCRLSVALENKHKATRPRIFLFNEMHLFSVYNHPSPIFLLFRKANDLILDVLIHDKWKSMYRNNTFCQNLDVNDGRS